MAYDQANKVLFVGDYNSNRILSYSFTANSANNGPNANNALGQYSDETGTLAPVYTKSIVGNTPNRLGLYTPEGVIIDSVGHRLFVSDTFNNRVLVYNLNTSNQLLDYIPDNVLGQADFVNNGVATTSTGMRTPIGLAYDSTNQRLFVADANNQRILAYNLADGLTNGEVANGVLGQSSFTSNTNTTTATGLSGPYNLAYDSTNQRLFVADYTNNRVLAYNLADGLTNGEAAIGVLGQSSFTTSTLATTATGMINPIGLAYDSTNQRLFVSELSNHRVLAYNLADGLTNGEAAVNVLGQTTFTSLTSDITQSKFNGPRGVAYDSTNNRLYVSDGSTNNRVMVFDVASIANGENAVNVLGQTNFTSANTAGSTNKVFMPFGLAYDSTNQRLFVAASGNHRIMVFDVVPDATAPTITSISSTTANGSYKIGQNINITLTFSEPVIASVGAVVTLETGTTDRTCTTASGGSAS
ncbi:MAG: beta-propeller fold lactonase family protein, partial [bacterium]